MDRQRRSATGFTLIEMLVAMAVLVILLSLAAPAFNKIIVSQRIKNASFDLFAALNYARSEAVKRGSNISLRAGETSDGAWTTGWRVVDGGGNRLRSWGATSNLDLTEAGSLTVVTFSRSGRLGTAAPKIQVAPSTSLTGVTTRCISVDLSGRPTSETGNCS